MNRSTVPVRTPSARVVLVDVPGPSGLYLRDVGVGVIDVRRLEIDARRLQTSLIMKGALHLRLIFPEGRC